MRERHRGRVVRERKERNQDRQSIESKIMLETKVEKGRWICRERT